MSGEFPAGKVQVYTGDGKGKTTAAFGQALRMWGRGFKVVIIQFLKNGDSGEIKALKNAAPGLKVYTYGSGKFISAKGPSEEDLRIAEDGIFHAEKILKNKEADMLVLDEANVAVSKGLIMEERLLALLKDKPKNIEIILTGRNISEKVVEAADLVTEMRKIKHPFETGTEAREGIEY